VKRGEPARPASKGAGLEMLHPDFEPKLFEPVAALSGAEPLRFAGITVGNRPWRSKSLNECYAIFASNALARRNAVGGRRGGVGTSLGSDLTQRFGQRSRSLAGRNIIIEVPKLPVAACVYNPISAKTADANSLTDRTTQHAGSFYLLLDLDEGRFPFVQKVTLAIPIPVASGQGTKEEKPPWQESNCRRSYNL
jgi:hypothetical protein